LLIITNKHNKSKKKNLDHYKELEEEIGEEENQDVIHFINIYMESVDIGLLQLTLHQTTHLIKHQEYSHPPFVTLLAPH
jgi:hypothetical protein